jgi:hypothetical protein
MKVLLISFVFLNSAFAADCVIGDGHTAMTVREADQISLFDTGKSLSTHKVQDQDGLGTCYANATSVVLKSVLPNNPDVSYINSALEASTRGVNSNWVSNNQRFSQRSADGVRDVTYSGQTCPTVKAVKQAGGACPAAQSILENRTLRDSYVQERLMINMGTYFDDLNSIQTNPEEAQKFKEQLSLTVESLNAKRARLVDTCNAEKSAPIPITNGLKRMISGELLSLNERPCEEQIRKAFKTMLPGSYISSDRNKIILNDGIKNSLLTMINASPKVQEILLKVGRGISLTAREKLVMMDDFGKILSDFMKNHVTSSEMKTCLGGQFTPSTDAIGLGNFFVADMEIQKQMNCEQEIKNSTILAKLAAEGNQCIPPARLEVILNAIAPLMEVGTVIDSGILNTLTNPLATLGNQLKQMIAPGCQTRANLINMDNVGCQSYSTCQESDLGSVYGGPKNGCTTLAEAKKVLGRQIINGIRQNRALGIDVCTAFMENPAVVSNFCRNAPTGIPGHSFHAMAVSGYRCVAGKMEYEILNSWGKEHCPIGEAPYKNSAIECVLDANGRPTGKWWAKEDVLFDNTTRIIDVTNGTP